MTQPDNHWDWIGTFETLSGTFNVLNPNPNDIHLNDIAHALSNICRYNGHTPHYYSVAEHSVHVVNQLKKTHQGHISNRLLLTGLLHDAAEAYIGDMIRPLKRHPQYGQHIRQADTTITNLILTKYKAHNPIPHLIEQADQDVYNWERNNILTGTHIGLNPPDAKHLYLTTYHQLAG